MADPLQSSEMAENSWRSNAINEVYLRPKLISFWFLILYTVQYDMVRIHFSLLSTVIFACTVLYNVLYIVQWTVFYILSGLFWCSNVNTVIITVTIVYSRKIIHKVVVFLNSKLFLEYFLFVLRVIIFLIEIQPQNVAGFKMAPGALPPRGR